MNLQAPGPRRTGWSNLWLDAHGEENPAPGGSNSPAGRRGASYVLLIVAIVIVAAFLRFAALDQYPQPIHQDELSDTYDGYSIATTGADRAGEPWPIIFRGMGPGDYHPGLYVYLTAATTGAMGFSVWAGRLPAAIVGTLTVVLVFLTARQLLGRTGAVLALLLIAFSPAHVLYSRQGHTGGCLPPLFAVLIVYLLQRSLAALGDAHRRHTAGVWIAAAGFAVGLSTSAYGAARLSGLLFALLGAALLAVQLGVRQGAWRRAGVAVAGFTLAVGLGALPQLYAMIAQPEQFFSRASNVVPPFSNGLRWWVKKVVINLGLNLDPQHLFFSFGEYHLLSIARLSIVSLPFLYIGLFWALLRSLLRRHLPTVLLVSSTFVCLMSAAVSRPNPHPLRASGVWALYPIVSALGALAIGAAGLHCWKWLYTRSVDRLESRSHKVILHYWKWISKTPRGVAPGANPRYANTAMIGAGVLGTAIAVVGLVNVVQYLEHPGWHGLGAQNHLVKVGKWIGERGEGYDRIYVDVPGLFPYLYVAVFSGMSPEQFQRTPREGIVTALGWEKFHTFGRFHFAPSERTRQAWELSDKSERWLLVRADEDPVEFLPERQARAAP